MITERELPAEYRQLLDEFRSVYLPINSVAESIVRDIAVARWQILRLDSLIFGLWDLSLADDAPDQPNIHRFNRQIDQLNVRIARLERRLKFVHANFATAVGEQPPQPVENTNEADKPIPFKEYSPEVVAFYQRYYPKSRIIIMPPIAAANGVNTNDRMNL